MLFSRVRVGLLLLLLVMFSLASSYKLTSRLSLRLGRSLSSSRAAAESAKTFLNVPFDEKDAVKALGGHWDKDAKQWFVPEGADCAKFSRWQKIFLSVPFSEGSEAKALGARWDAVEKKWFVCGWAPNVDSLKKWMSSSPPSASAAANAVNAADAAPKPPLKPEDAIVVLDLDTNGLPAPPRGRKASFADLLCFDSSRIVQISYALCDKTSFEVAENGSFVIQSDGFPIQNTQFHGVSEQISQSQGIPFERAAKRVLSAIARAQYLVSHNAEFDLNVFKSELFRYGLLEDLEMVRGKTELCSMSLTARAVGLLDKAGNPKNPTLKELVSHALHEELPAVHNAPMDVEFVRRSLQQLVKQNLITIPPQ